MIESINLNLIPSGVSPVCHVSQYDAGRQIKINLFEGINPYTIQSGDSFTLNVRKPDNTIVTTSVSGTQGNNYITIATTEQIAAVVGENLCELKITNGSTVIGTLNFIMQVERDVLADGIPSQSVIEDLDERISEAIGDNYYNKTETDSLLALKADKSDTYTKSETDALLAVKADKSELYNVYPTEQESGAIASFTDGADNIPVKSLVSQIVAVESGNGQPKSPINPYTISGFDSGIITRCGKNFLEPTLLASSTVNGITFTALSDGTIRANGTATANAVLMINNITGGGNLLDNLLPLNNVACIGSGCPSVAGCRIAFARMDGSSFYDERGSGVSFTVSNLTPSTNAYVRLQIDSGYTVNNIIFKPMIRLASVVDDTYEAYNGTTYTFAFGQTVYGGHFDNKGNLVVTHGIVADMSQLSWTAGGTSRTRYDTTDLPTALPDYAVLSVADIDCEVYPTNSAANLTDKQICAFNQSGTNYVRVLNSDYVNDVAGFTSSLSGKKLVYKLANPITLAITSQDIPTLLGENNIFSNTGDVDVTIRADIGLYIEKRLNASRSTPNNLVRAASYVEEPESINETQEDNEER